MRHLKLFGSKSRSLKHGQPHTCSRFLAAWFSALRPLGPSPPIGPSPPSLSPVRSATLSFPLEPTVHRKPLHPIPYCSPKSQALGSGTISFSPQFLHWALSNFHLELFLCHKIRPVDLQIRPSTAGHFKNWGLISAPPSSRLYWGNIFWENRVARASFPAPFWGVDFLVLRQLFCRCCFWGGN